MQSGPTLEKLFPFRRNFATVAGFQMHYVDEGPVDEGPVDTNAPVVVCLHGNPTWSFYFRDLIRNLSRDFRVIAPDFIGCGLSDHPKDRHFRAVDRIDQVQNLLAQLGVNRYSLVMHDWGGPIGTGLALRNIPAICRMVYFNTTLTEIDSLPGIIRRAASPLIGRFLTQTTMQFLKLTTRRGVVRPLSRSIRDAYHSPYMTRERRTAIWDFVQDIPFADTHPTRADLLAIESQLPSLGHVPVLIVWGLRDPCFHRVMLDKVAHHFPQAKVVELPNASHLVLEDETDDSIAAVRGFLKAPQESFAAKATDVYQTKGRVRGLFGAFQMAAAQEPQSTAVTQATFPLLYSLFPRKPLYQTLSFAAISTLVARYEQGLTASGLVARDRVVILMKPGADFLAMSYAVMGRGAVPVFIDPGIGIANIIKCVEEAEPKGFIGIPRAHLLRLKAPRIFASMHYCVVATQRHLPGIPTLGSFARFPPLPLDPVMRCSDEEALIAFTSGATGVPKGVVFTNGMLEAQVGIFREHFGFQSGQQDCPLLPIFSLFTLALGGGSVFPPLNPRHPLAVKADQVVRIMNDCGVQSSFGSPTLWTKLGEYCLRSGTAIPALRKIFMAGAPVPAHTVELLRKIASAAESFTPYGSTEALPVTLISGTDLLYAQNIPAHSGEQGTLVGKPVQGVEVRIVIPTTPPLRELHALTACPPRVLGEVLVTGENVSTAYLRRPAANRDSKVIDGQRIWHRMGDSGYLDEAGNLYFCGRLSHAVVTDSGVFHSVPVERVFNVHPNVYRTALISTCAGTEAAIAVEPYANAWPRGARAKRAMAEELRAIGRRNPLTASITKFYFHRSFPVDARHNAKIFRDALSAWAATQHAVDLYDAATTEPAR